MSAAQAGELIAGRYRLQSVIGRGGMGVVWLAADELLRRAVAVKEIVWPAELGDEERDTLRERALREARTAARLDHPNIVRVFDVAEHDDRPWIVMQLVPYRSLRDVVAESGPLTPQQTARIGLPILSAITAAQAAGVLHRDVKPANVLLGPDDDVVLTDFGLAVVDGSTTVTSSGLVLGSPAYMAPERARGEPVTFAADLWSLGATLYAAVEGRDPFQRNGALAVLTAIATDEPDPPERAGPLWPVISELLRKDPAARPAADQVERDLRHVAGHVRSGVPALPGYLTVPLSMAELAAGTRAVVPPGTAADTQQLQPLGAPAETALGEPPDTAVGEPADTALGKPPDTDPPVPAAAPGPGPELIPGLRPAPRVPAPAAGPEPSRRRGRGRIAAAVIVLLALAGIGFGLALSAGPDRGRGPAAADQHAGGQHAGGQKAGGKQPGGGKQAGRGHHAARTPSPGSPPAKPGPSSAGRAGHVRYRDPSGFSLEIPTGWQISHSGHLVYVRPPSGGAFLLIDQTSHPQPNALADWQQQEASRISTYPGYHRIRLAAVNYPPAAQAADWEFTYYRSGQLTHVLNRNVLVNSHLAYALYWSVPQAQWAAEYHYFRAFAGSFQPASPKQG